jgi:hypothetical protein
MAEKRKPHIRVMPPEHHGGGPVKFMAEADGYVMARRAGCMPFVVSVTDWNRWPESNPNG